MIRQVEVQLKELYTSAPLTFGFQFRSAVLVPVVCRSIGLTSIYVGTHGARKIGYGVDLEVEVADRRKRKHNRPILWCLTAGIQLQELIVRAVLTVVNNESVQN